MGQKKQKKPSKNQPPSSRRLWNEAKQRFHLNDEQLAMAQAIEFTPILMDDVAMGKCIKRSPYDPLPRHATPGQVKKVQRAIRERYAASVKNNKGRLDEEKLTVTLPAGLKAHVEIQCAKEGLKLAEVVRTFLKARFPTVTPEERQAVTSLTTAEVAPPLAAPS